MPLELPGLAVSLRLGAGEGKEEIPVFKSETVNPHLISGFIPSVAGQSFEIWVDNDLVSGEGIAYTIFVDGREMNRSACLPFEHTSSLGVYSADGVRRFTFSKLQLKEDDGEAPSFDLSKLGVIEVHVWRAIVTDSSDLPAYDDEPAQASLDPVSEKTKKVGWHSVSLGPAKPTEDVQSSHAEFIDPLSNPYAVFRFRYKPRELLEDEGIAPRIEHPKASGPSAGDKRSRPEEDTGARHTAKRHAKQEDVKPEPNEGSLGGSQPNTLKNHGAKDVKYERNEVIDLTNRATSPIRIPMNGEVIDLSDD